MDAELELSTCGWPLQALLPTAPAPHGPLSHSSRPPVSLPTPRALELNGIAWSSVENACMLPNQDYGVPRITAHRSSNPFHVLSQLPNQDYGLPLNTAHRSSKPFHVLVVASQTVLIARPSDFSKLGCVTQQDAQAARQVQTREWSLQKRCGQILSTWSHVPEP